VPPFDYLAPVKAADFATDGALTAWPERTILFEFPPGVANAPPVRYYFTTATRRFCLDENEDYLDGMVLEDATGKSVLAIPSSETNPSCAQALLPAGIYTMRLKHQTDANTGTSPLRARWPRRRR
jgi:hypothetical protein